jgi:S1-C subfamily serine protease
MNRGPVSEALMPILASLAELSAALGQLAAAVSPSLVSVRSHHSVFSGFVWRPGLVVTADEALAEQGDVAITLPGGETVAARIAGRDATTDVALLRIESSSLPPLALADEPAETGGLVLLLGAEDGAATAALGVISRVAGAWHSLRGGDIDARIELDLRLRRSAEGGVVLNAAGRALGMAVFGPRRRSLVMPSATIARVAATLEKCGRIPRGYLGLGLQTVTLADSQRTAVMVMSVDPKGPGAAAGLFQGDILLAWEGTALGNFRALLRSLGSDSVGRAATLTIRRGGETREVRLTVGERQGT